MPSLVYKVMLTEYSPSQEEDIHSQLCETLQIEPSRHDKLESVQYLQCSPLMFCSKGQ
jgi:hypothetical protein